MRSLTAEVYEKEVIVILVIQQRALIENSGSLLLMNALIKIDRVDWFHFGITTALSIESHQQSAYKDGI